MADGTADTGAVETNGQGVSTDRKIAFLRRPDSHPGHSRVEVIETHFSWVFLTGTCAYKLKKPVKGDGFDFRPVEARRRNAIIETRLNRRLAPDVYLGVVPIAIDQGGKLAIGGDGTPVDWLVRMLRLNGEQTLERRLARNDLSNTDIAVLARRLAGFYATAHRIKVSPARFNGRIKQELVASHRAFQSAGKPPLLNSLNGSRRCLMSFLKHRRSLFRDRIDRGHIVDGHGDLRPEHIYLNANPRIIDCLEFRADLRIVDPVCEIAYLALECRRLGDDRVGTQLLHRYRQRTGDNAPPNLLHFYAALNALIRARIAIQHLSEPGARTPREWVSRAVAYLNIAARECQSLSPQADHSPSAKGDR